jgi:hypothetical protein
MRHLTWLLNLLLAATTAAAIESAVETNLVLPALRLTPLLATPFELLAAEAGKKGSVSVQGRQALTVMLLHYC